MLNTIAYTIYLPITFVITIQVGWQCYTHGWEYLKASVPIDHQTLAAINRLLLVGYYLVNLGYAAITLSYWEPLTTIIGMVGMLCYKLGLISIILGTMHMLNLLLAAQIPRLLKTH